MSSGRGFAQDAAGLDRERARRCGSSAPEVGAGGGDFVGRFLLHACLRGVVEKKGAGTSKSERAGVHAIAKADWTIADGSIGHLRSPAVDLQQAAAGHIPKVPGKVVRDRGGGVRRPIE